MRSNASLLGVGVILSLASLSLAQDKPEGADVKALASFGAGNPFTTGTLIREFPSDRDWPIIKGKVVAEHGVSGAQSLEVSDGALILQGPMDWRGYDYLKVDVFNRDSVPRWFGIEAQDPQSTGYWQQILY